MIGLSPAAAALGLGGQNGDQLAAQRDAEIDEIKRRKKLLGQVGGPQPLSPAFNAFNLSSQINAS